jgi:transcriptional regulator with XRE-family HTH domain
MVSNLFKFGSWKEWLFEKRVTDMATSETLGRCLQRLRRAASLTQEELAHKAQVPVWSLRNWEHDHRLPGLVATYKVAKALGVLMEELASCAAQSIAVQRRKHRKTK